MKWQKTYQCPPPPSANRLYFSMSYKNNNSGRTLLETLSVLVVIAILLLAILLGYNYVRDRWKRQETIKMVTELAVRYRANPIRPKKDSRIPIKTVYPVPESMRVGDVLKASDKKGATIYLEAGEDTSVFSVFSKDIMPLTCQELLESGNYESFVDSDSQICTSKEHKGRIISKKSFDKKSPEERRELIEKICHSEHVCVHLVYGQTCKDGGHYYDHECHNCESGRFEDVYGKCCEAINACGVCACPNGDVCKEETQECVECTKNADCKDSSKPICDESTNTCVECKENKDCKEKGADYKCDLSTHTCTECKEGYGVKWNADLGICDCITRLSAGATCSPNTNCCKLGLSCMDFGESGYKCAECQEHPDCKNPDYPVCKGNTCQRCPKTPTKEGDECYAVCEACPVDIGLTCGNGNKCICNGEDNFKHWNGSKCVECTEDNHCADNEEGKTLCDTANYECVDCPPNATTEETLQKIPNSQCYCKVGYVLNEAKTGCKEAVCTIENTGMDASVYTGAVAGKATDGATECRCSATLLYWNGSSCVECTENAHCAGNTDGKTTCDTGTNKCSSCPEGWHLDGDICCPFGQVNLNGSCTCENPANNCGTACCNGIGETCRDAEKGVCCATDLCGGVCCPMGSTCQNEVCTNPCEEGKHIVDYFTQSGVKQQTCCPNNTIGADWAGNCCPEGTVGAFGHNHYWVYISRCCPKEGQENKGMIGLAGLAETYSCAPPDTTMEASQSPGGGEGHTWYVPRGSKNVEAAGWACAPETTRGGVLHVQCGSGTVCQHGWEKGYYGCTYCYGEWDEKNICRLPDCTKPRQHIAYCYCNPDNGSSMEFNYYTGGSWYNYFNDVCVTPQNGSKKPKCTKGISFYDKTYGCMSCDTYIDSYSSSITDQDNCFSCSRTIWKNNTCSQCPANAHPDADRSACVCDDGFYMGTDNVCRSCSDGWYATTTKEACYATCPNNSRMWSEYSGSKYCFDCNYLYGISNWFTKAECDHCPNRYFKDGGCYLCPANSHPNTNRNGCVCDEGFYMSDGACYSCSDGTVLATTEEDCYATCPNNSRMWSKYSGYNYCFDCNYPYGVSNWFTKKECDHCPNRYFSNGNCALCPSGKHPNATKDGCE